jgi:hypothetical protein
MSIQFNFRADSIAFSRPGDINFAGSNSSVIMTTNPVVEPIRDAINNVRFACTGFAGNGVAEAASFALRTRHLFVFSPPGDGRVGVASTFYMPLGTFRLVARKSANLFDDPGSAVLRVETQMRMRIFAANGQQVGPSLFSARTARLHVSAVATRSASVTREGVLAPELMEWVDSIQPTIPVFETDRVQLRAQMIIGVIAVNGAEFFLDFSSVRTVQGNPGFGSNVPMAVLNVSS